VSKENLKFAAKIPELDIDKFNSCFDNQKYKSFVEKDVALASSLGFQETPSFVIVNSKDGSNPEGHGMASFYIDNRANENQFEALSNIITGRAGEDLLKYMQALLKNYKSQRKQV
jgi:protein-disulfide isomerase